MSEKRGYVKAPREFFDSQLWLSERFTRGQAWWDLYVLANHAPALLFIRGNEVRLKPGQLAWSQLSLGKRWKWSYKTVVKFLRYLQLSGKIHSETSSLTTVITILDWNDTQRNPERNPEQSTDRIPTDKNVENGNNQTVVTGEEGSFPKDDSKNNGSPVSLFRAWWTVEFNQRYGSPYVFQHGKDEKIIKDLLVVCGGNIEKLRARALRFFSNDDDFLEKTGHTLGMFLKRFNSLGEKSERKASEPTLTETQRYLQEQAK